MLIVWTILGAAIGLGINAITVRWPANEQARRAVRLPRWAAVVMPLAGAGVVGALSVRVPDTAALLVAAGCAGVLLLLAALDVCYRLVPNALVAPALIAAVLVGPAGPGSAVAGTIAGLLVFGSLAWLGDRAYDEPPLGMGDVKLAGLLGAVVGMNYVWPALLLGMVLAGLLAVVLLAARVADRRSTIPYGSFLAVAGLVLLFFAVNS